jgi:hypothetical protein
MSTDSFSKKFLIPSLPLIAIFLLSLWCTFPLMTNTITPTGDGKRILAYADYAKHVPEHYPLWDANANMGESTLSNPDVFLLPNLFINFFDGYGNIKLNLLFIAAVTFIGFSLYFLARELGLRPSAALLVATVYLLSQNNYRMVYCGRLYWITHTALAILSIYLYLLSLRKNTSVLFWIAALLWGVSFSYIGYYSLVVTMPLMVVISLQHNVKLWGKKIGMIKALTQLSGLWILGCVMASFFIFPIIDTVIAYASALPGNALVDMLPHPASWINFLFGMDVSEKALVTDLYVPFLSLSGYPLIACAVTVGTMRSFPPGSLIRHLLLLCTAYLLVLLGAYYPFRLIPDLLSHIPIISHIRHGLSFQDGLAMCGALLLGCVYDFLLQRHDAFRINWLWTATAGVVLVVLALAVDYWVVAGPDLKVGWNHRHFLHSGLKDFLTLKGCMALLLLCGPWPFLFRKTPITWRAKTLIWGLVLIQGVFFLPAYRGDYLRQRRTTNEPYLSPLLNYLNNDSSYYKVMFSGMSIKNVGWGGIQTLVGFQFNFSPELRGTLSQLLGRQIQELRPHWVDISIEDKINEKMAALLGIKYFVVNSKLQPQSFGGFGSRLEDTGISSGSWRLYKYNGWYPPLVLYSHWRVVPDAGRLKTEVNITSPGDELLLSASPGFEPSGQNDPSAEVKLISRGAESMDIEVRSAAGGILFIPERYDTGWKARVDNSPTQIIRANGAFRAVPLPAGTHNVRLFYSPWWKTLGAALSSIAIIGSFGLAVILDRRKYKQREPDGLPLRSMDG